MPALSPESHIYWMSFTFWNPDILCTCICCISLLKISLMCLWVGVWVCSHECSCPQRQEALGPLELESQNLWASWSRCVNWTGASRKLLQVYSLLTLNLLSSPYLYVTSSLQQPWGISRTNSTTPILQMETPRFREVERCPRSEVLAGGLPSVSATVTTSTQRPAHPNLS